MQDSQDTGWMQVLGNIVHDLKAPLSSVKTLIDGIAEVGELNDRQQYFADRARGKLVHMVGMINTILEMTWMDADHPLSLAPVDLYSMIQYNLSLQQEAADQRSIELRSEIPASLGLIEADERLMQQMLSNLIGNAVKYNRDNGYVKVTAVSESDRVRLTIEDSGKGIPLEDQPHVFERFYRAKASSKVEGTGLGLAIVKTAVERHHGEISFVSVPDQGSTFTLVLPRHQAPPEAAPERATGEMRRISDSVEGHSWSVVEDTGEEKLDAVDDSIQEAQDGADEIADAHAEAGGRMGRGD
ncbi:MAG: HAMP domain-containing sensor histidine kinase [Anaerolineae bacterium]